MDRLILKNRDDVLSPLTTMSIASVGLKGGKRSTDTIDGIINEVRVPFIRLGEPNTRHTFIIPTQNMFLIVGTNVIALLASNYKLLASDFQEPFIKMLLEKHKRYGATPILAWGPIGVMVRIHSKFERFMNLAEYQGLDTDPDESIIDTLKDILGYSILGYCISEAP